MIIRGSRVGMLWLASFLLMTGVSPGLKSFPQGVAARKLPQFELKLIDGISLTSGDLAGKVTVIDFWGTWCKPCLAEIPAYNQFYRSYKDKGVYFLALAADSGTPEQLQEAVKRLKIQYPVAAPTWDELDLFGDLQYFPTTQVYDAQGRLAKEFHGVAPKKQEALREIVDSLLLSK